MPYFVWKGLNSYGEKRNGIIDSPDIETATAQLRKMRIQDLVLKEKPKDLLESIPFLAGKASHKDVILFTRQLSTMLDAGLPLVQSLDVLSSQQDNPAFKEILTTVKNDIEVGTTFADSLKKHPKIFPSLYANMIEAGEVGGILDTILNRLAAFLEKAMALKKKITGAMVYPAVCLGISLIMLVVILVFVIPVFDKMFSEGGNALPLPTQIVINMSRSFKSNFIWWVLGFSGVSFLFKRFKATERGEMLLDRFSLVAPVIGDLLRKSAVAKFARTLSTMLKAGVPILESLHVVARTSGNKVLEQAVFRVSEAIKEGRPIAEPLFETGVFPPMVVQMINIGESVGALDTMLEKIADFYDEEVDQAVDNLTAALEPLMMVFLGVIIGGLVIAMYLPIFQMASAVGS